MASNLQEDTDYVEKLEELKSKKRRELIGTVTPIKNISISARQFFSIGELSKVDALLKAASLKLVRAEAALDAGEADSADQLLNEYKNMIDSISDDTQEGRSEEEAKHYAAVRKKVDEHVSFYKKEYALFLPDEDQYPLKEAVQSAELNAAASPVEKTEVILEQANEKLLEAEELHDKGQTQLATEQIEAYVEAVDQVAEPAKDLKNFESIKKDTKGVLSLDEVLKKLDDMQQGQDKAKPDKVGSGMNTERGNSDDTTGPLGGVTVIEVDASPSK